MFPACCNFAGFILGLTDFLADALALPGGRQSALPYLITVLPPFAVAVTNPDIFLKALDTAGEQLNRITCSIPDTCTWLYSKQPAGLSMLMHMGCELYGYCLKGVAATQLVGVWNTVSSCSYKVGVQMLY